MSLVGLPPKSSPGHFRDVLTTEFLDVLLMYRAFLFPSYFFEKELWSDHEIVSKAASQTWEVLSLVAGFRLSSASDGAERVKI